MRYLSLIIFLNIYLTFSAHAQDVDACLASSKTQSDMNVCEGVSYKNADDELNRVYQLIRKVYQDEPEFLSKLKTSQLAWIKLRDADLEMMFPLKDKRLHYGSVYSMCSSGVSKTLTIQRIEYLKQWLVGISEGDVCSGSIKKPFIIQSTIKNITSN